MARMYGSVRGNRGDAHRLGHNKMITYCATTSGAIRCEAFIHTNGTDWVHVSMETWQGAGMRRTIYRGPIGKFTRASLGETIDWKPGEKS
jgi:hypothetical protein